MSGFSNYEADQSKLYSGAHHDDRNSAESKAKVKRILTITAWLTLITIIEVSIGLYCYSQPGMSKAIPNFFFIVGTLLKAWLIVSVFMHLGDEIQSMIMTIIMPLTLFIWFIIAFLYDGNFWLWITHHIYN